MRSEETNELGLADPAGWIEYPYDLSAAGFLVLSLDLPWLHVPRQSFSDRLAGGIEDDGIYDHDPTLRRWTYQSSDTSTALALKNSLFREAPDDEMEVR